MGGGGFGDSWIAIAVRTDQQWQALTAINGMEALHRPEYDTLAGRKQHEDEIDTIIETWTQSWDRQELAAFLQERGVPAGPFQGISEITTVDPVLSDAYFVRMQHPVGREFLVHGSPIQLRRRPSIVERAPLLGEHTYMVLHDIVGLSGDEIADLAARNVIE